MADATAISIAAVATTGLATGVAGPLIVSRATSRGQARKFHHERSLRDLTELRRLLDETSEAFNLMLRRFAGFDTLITKVGVGKASEEALDEISTRIDDFEATASKLSMRVGPDSELSTICQRLIFSVEEIQNSLYEAHLLRRRLESDRLTAEERQTVGVDEMKILFDVVNKAGNLQEFRPAFLVAAYEVAGATEA